MFIWEHLRLHFYRIPLESEDELFRSWSSLSKGNNWNFLPGFIQNLLYKKLQDCEERNGNFPVGYLGYWEIDFYVWAL